MKIIQCEQGTKEWHDARLQMVTGTDLDAVMGTPVTRCGLIAEKIAQKATEQAGEFVTSSKMERGTAEEPFAIKEFERVTGKRTEKHGMWVSDEFPWLSVSPDAPIVNEENPGLFVEVFETKNPDSKNAILYRMHNMIPLAELGMLTAKGTPVSAAPFLGIPQAYKWQVVQYFLVNEKLEKLYFGIHDARFIDQKEKLYIVTVERSNEILQEAMKEAREELIKFREDWLKWEAVVLPTHF